MRIKHVVTLIGRIEPKDSFALAIQDNKSLDLDTRGVLVRYLTYPTPSESTINQTFGIFLKTFSNRTVISEVTVEDIYYAFTGEHLNPTN